jgi:hypothetical protein
MITPRELTNMIFGDIYHPSVVADSNKYIKNVNTNINKLVLEISSRKVRYYNDIPLNYYYSNRKKSRSKFKLIEKILSDDDINNDLDRIVTLSKKLFNENIEIHVIPHLNLKTKSTLDYIYGRNKFVTLLEDMCVNKKIYVHNIGKYIENTTTKDCFIEDYMSDSTHYSIDCKNLKGYLINSIY